MAQRKDYIPERRTKRGRQRTQEPDEELPTVVSGPDPDAQRRIKIAGVLLGVFAILLLIALLTYTSKDEANAQLTIRDLLGVVRGDPDLQARFDTTHNWLGLLGAVVAHWLYVSTVGIWSIALPVLMLFWSRDLVRHQRITPLIRRYTGATFSTAVVVAAVFATFQLVPWMPEIDRVLCGSIGQFLAGTLTQFIGAIGSLAALIVVLGFVVVYGFNIEPTMLKVMSTRFFGMFKDKVRRKNSDVDDEDSHKLHDDDEDYDKPKNLGKGAILRPRAKPRSLEDEDGEEEPAVMLKRDSQRLRDKDESGATDSTSPVKIVRPSMKGGRSEPLDETEQQGDKQDSKPAVDLSAVQQRLQALHPKKEIEVRSSPTAKGPSEPGDAPELPLFLTDDDDEDANEISLPQGVSERLLTVTVEEGAIDEPEVPLKSVTLYDEEISYKPPPAKLLVDERDEIQVDDEELRMNAQILQDKLETFRIKIENVTVQPGPVVTQFEFVPASGVKVSQIESLADDIALALKAPAVRIIAPIPGKGTVGIEIPNLNPSIVRFGSIIKSPKYQNPDIKLPLAMGKTVIGEVFCADLTKMPHLLIAGATGKGKSVGINTIIASLLYRMHPRDIKFVIIDPKRVEMALYRDLKNHFLAVCPDIDEIIVTEPHNAVTMLKSVVLEMQVRYTVLAAAGQRNIAEYNRKVKDGKITNKGGMNHRPMPYIVVVIDELADLMMTAGKEVEEPIVRLAQLARAVGIHCVVATQRPSVDVVTGLIKANFPARISYQVSSRIDSRTILDTSGAENLIGNGDMLFVPGNTPKPIRMQNAFISTEECELITEHIGRQKGYSKPYTLPSVNKKSGGRGLDSDDRDVLFEDAARTFISLQTASVSTLQRRLKVGYARAARIVDELESAGIVGPPDGSKGRAVLLQSEAELEAYL